MAKQTIQVGDLRITFSGPRAALPRDGDTVSVGLYRGDDGAEALAAAEALGGADALTPVDPNSVDREVGGPGSDDAEAPTTCVTVSGPEGGPTGVNTVIGRWKDRA